MNLIIEFVSRAKEAGITIIQEVGLDPGIDHLLAMECIDSIREKGGKVSYFDVYSLSTVRCIENTQSWAKKSQIGGKNYVK